MCTIYEIIASIIKVGMNLQLQEKNKLFCLSTKIKQTRAQDEESLKSVKKH